MLFERGSFDINAEAVIGADVNVNGQPAMRVEDIKPFAEYKHKPPEWIVEGFLPGGSIVLCWGGTGDGKSTFCHVLAMAVADGVDFIGRKVKARDVLILDRENSPCSLQGEFARIRFKEGPRLRIWGGWCGQQAPALGSVAILEWVRDHPQCLIIVDAYLAFFDGDSENDAVETRRFIEQARVIADMGGTVVYLHHPGKDPEKGPRGSSDIRPAIDYEFRFSNYDTSGRGYLDRITIKSDKTRFEPVTINLQYSDGQFLVDTVAHSKTVTEQLTDLLRENPGSSTGEFETLAGQKGLGQKRARGFLSQGIKNGSVYVEKSGPRNDHFLTSAKTSATGFSTGPGNEKLLLCRDESKYEQ